MRERKIQPYEVKLGRHLVKVKVYPFADKVLYELLKERAPEQSISHKRMPTWEEHKTFMEKPGYRSWCIIALDDKAVGAVYMTPWNELGIAIFKAYQRQGHASWAVAAMMKRWGPFLRRERVGVPGKFLANVNPNNAASIAFWEALGFDHKQNTYVWEPLA